MRYLPALTAITAVSVLGASSAFAQQGQTAGRLGQTTGLCGQTVSLTYTLGQSIDVSPMAPLSVNIVRSEPIYVEFSLDADTRFVARTTSNDGGDPFLTIYNANGNVVTEDDDSAGDLDSMVNTSLPAGSYCAQVRPLSGSSNEPMVTLLTMATGEAAEELAATATAGSGGGSSVDYSEMCNDPALTADLARDIGLGFGTLETDVNILPGAWQDWRFTVTESTALQIDTTDTTFDTVLTLVDGDNNYVDENDDGPNNTDSQIITRIEPGTYCMRLSGFDNAGGDAKLVITDELENPPAGPVETACTDPELTQEFGTVIAPGMGTVSVPLDVGINSRNDWQIEVTETVEVQLDSRSSILDTVMTLVDADGRVIDENDDGPLNTDSQIKRTLSPGRYCVAVGGYEGTSGTGELVISDNPDPDPIDSSSIPGCSDPAMTADMGQTIGPDVGSFTLSTTIEQGSRQDWTMEVTEEALLRLDAKSEVFDTTLRISNMSGGLIAENDDILNGTGTNSQIETTLSPGNYCVTLEGFAGAGGAGELQVLAIDEAMRGQIAVERGEVLPDAAEIEDLGMLETSLQSSAMASEQTRWVGFTLDEASTVTVNAVSASGGFTLRLFEEAGTMVEEMPGREGMTPTTLTSDLPPGRYVVGMSMNDGVTARLRNILITRE